MSSLEEQISTRAEGGACLAAPSEEKQGVALTDNRCAGQWPLRQLVHTPVITCCQRSALVQLNLCLECHTSTQTVFKNHHKTAADETGSLTGVPLGRILDAFSPGTLGGRPSHPWSRSLAGRACGHCEIFWKSMAAVDSSQSLQNSCLPPPQCEDELPHWAQD